MPAGNMSCLLQLTTRQEYKSMLSTDIIFLIVFFIFLEIYFDTQVLYIKKRFSLLLVVSVSLPILAFIVAREGDKLRAVLVSLMVFYYFFLLFIVSKTYRQITKFLINKKWIEKQFDGKDYTQVHWDGDIGIQWWDEKISKEPSWLDDLLSFLLLILPLFLTAVVFSLIHNGS